MKNEPDFDSFSENVELEVIWLTHLSFCAHAEAHTVEL